MRLRIAALLVPLLLVLAGPQPAAAHGIGQVYQLPIPLEYYMLGAGAAVAASFFVFALFLADRPPQSFRDREVRVPLLRPALMALRAALALLLLAVVSAGLFGTADPLANVAPSFFWVFFLIGFTFASLAVGNLWERLSPLRAAVQWSVAVDAPKTTRAASGSIAAVLLLGLFWWELVSGVSFRPDIIAIVLLLYVVVTFGLGRIFHNWFADADVLSVLFGFVGRLAWLRIGHDDRTLLLTSPAARLTTLPGSWWALGIAGVLLGSASFDSLKESVIWFDWLEALGLESVDARIVGTVGLVATAAFFVGSYLVAVIVMAVLVGQPSRWRALATQFVWALIPVAVAYTLAHNFPLALVTAPHLVALASDPFGYGWDLFGTASFSTGLLLGARSVWFVEIGLVVLGHIGGIWLAHALALGVFSDRSLAARSQYPMALLMVVYTGLTLWLLAQPLVVSP